MTFSKISVQLIKCAILKIKNNSKYKQRNFTETIELQGSLKNYDPRKDKKISGTLILPYIPKIKKKIAIIGDSVHIAEALKQNLDSYGLEELKKFNKQKKQIKKFAKKYDFFFASESIIKYIPKILGPGLNKMGKFPTLLTRSDNLVEKTTFVKSSIKFEIKKSLCIGVILGNVIMKNEDLIQNTYLAINFFVSLLKKNWQNIKSLFLKSTMGVPIQIY